MKQKKKLIVDRDQELFSPSMLVQSNNQSERQQKILKPRFNSKRIQRKPEDNNNYMIEINESKQQERQSLPKQYATLNLENPDVQSSCHKLKQLSNKLHSYTSKQQIIIDDQITKMKEAVQNRRTRQKSCKLFFQNHNVLEVLIKNQKVHNITKNFIKKMRRSSVYYSPVDYDKVKVEEQSGFLYLSGVELPVVFDTIMSVLSVVQIISLLMIYTLSIVFADLMTNYTILIVLQRISLGFYLLQICLNFITVKFQAGKKLQIIKEIIDYYISHNFGIDFISFVILFFDVTTNLAFIKYCRLFIIFKLPQCLNKIQKIEVYLVRNLYHEQYWELTKVFLVNFGYAHIVSLILILTTNFDSNENWILTKGLQGSSWIQVYVWSFYWATNMMLTVGFGDIVPVNYVEAIIVIFIETFSCFIMAYNINRVGTIISNIRLQDQNRSRKFKAFKKLTRQNDISEQLTFKINNYIEESSKMKKHFNLQEDRELLNELPVNLRITYLRQANKEILNKLVFFKTLLDRTLCNFAQKLQAKIAHPQQIIRSIDDDFNLIILRKGHIGLICKKKQCPFNNYITDQIKVKEGDTPFLTSLDFISKVRPNYQIQSLRFSVLYTLSYQSFIEIFRSSDMDYELYCFLRDKCRNIPDQFQVYTCQYCKNYNHYKFTCPRLHYVPSEQHIINKQLYKERVGHNKRRFYSRSKNLTFTPSEYFKKMKTYQSRIMEDRYIVNTELVQSIIANKESSHCSSEVKKSINRNITSVYLQSLLDEKTKQGIQIQFLKKQNKKRFEDEIWNINLDEMANFSSYFHLDNPKFLHEKFSFEERLKKLNNNIISNNDQKLTFQQENTNKEIRMDRKDARTESKHSSALSYLSLQLQ